MGALVAKVSRLCEASIAWALAHRAETIDALLATESRSDLALDRAMLDRYLAMYANTDTLSPPSDVPRAIEEMFRRANAIGLLPEIPRVELA